MMLVISTLGARPWLVIIGLGFLFLLIEHPFWQNWQLDFGVRQILSLEKEKKTLRDDSSTTIDSTFNNHHPLGSFLYRPHVHEVLNCSKLQELSRTTPLICEGLETLIVDGNKTDRRCGGLILKPGLCMMAERASYKYRLENEKKDEKNGIIIFQKPNKQLCSLNNNNEYPKFAQGSFANYRYHGPHCELVDIHPRWMHQTFQNKIIVFAGDSHARNLFTSFIAEVRNQKFVSERHPDKFTKDNLFPYQRFDMGVESDHLQDLTGSNQLTASLLRQSCGDEKVLNGASSSSCSVIALYIWAGFLNEYEALLCGALLKINPDVIITDFISKPYATAEGLDSTLNKVSTAWDQFFKAQKRDEKSLVKFIVSPFPLFGGDLVFAHVDKWLKSDIPLEYAKTVLIDQVDFIKAYRRGGAELNQLRHTSHSVCSLYDSFSLDPKAEVVPPHKVVGFESCVAPVDRAIVRAALTFAAAQ